MTECAPVRLAKQIVDYPETTPQTISTSAWLRDSAGSHPAQRIRQYFISLFPILGWITKYNMGWFTGDLVAGLTVGLVLVPQGMSYAQIATLPAEYGLYSSFVGVLLYCFFATSKDVSIGPVAVLSLTVSQIIKHVDAAKPNEWTAPEIATTLSFICGFIVLGVGLLRLGWLVEFIPAPAVSGFMTGSAINIVSGQLPGLMGITGFDTRAATYKVIIDTLKGLPNTKLDAAWGIPGLVSLYSIRFLCDRLTKRYPTRARALFFISVLRNAIVILILTVAAWLYVRHRQDASGNYPIKILKNVPRGFKHIGAPAIDRELIKTLAPDLPVATIILLLEHIAISKSFGRINGYKINPNQELIAIGVTNTVGSCFGAYPATGSFSRSALAAKSGVRTPASGLVTAVIIIVALYGLTSAFYWIPTAALSAVIIHAVANLVASPSQVYSFWRVSPLEFFIWVAAVLITIFSTIENGIYVSIAASLVLVLLRISHPRGAFLGKVIIRDNSLSGTGAERTVFVPMKDGVMNPHIEVLPPAPGVIIYRHEESYIYPNSHVLNSNLVDYVKANTKRGKDTSQIRLADRPWNDPGPSRDGIDPDQERAHKLPAIRAVVLDFSSISQLDTTAVQSLIDARDEIERWADHPVEFHFASILSPWIHRALVAGGFGTGTPASGLSQEVATIIPYRDDPGSSGEQSGLENSKARFGSGSGTPAVVTPSELEPVMSQETPFFHIDLLSAVNAAEIGLSVSAVCTV